MAIFTQFFTMALVAIAAENAVFSRALGVSKNLLYIHSIQEGILYGSVLTVVATLSSLLTFPLNVLIGGKAYTSYVRVPVFFASVCLVYVLVYFIAKRHLSAHFEEVGKVLPGATFNTALFGALYVPATQGFSFLKTTGYAMGMGIGFTVALLVVFTARKRLLISDVPRSFRGMPIVLLYIGLLSLAIFGLIGHELPN